MDGAPLNIGHRPAASWSHPTPHDLYGGGQSKPISHRPVALQMEPAGHECSFIFNFFVSEPHLAALGLDYMGCQELAWLAGSVYS